MTIQAIRRKVTSCERILHLSPRALLRLASICVRQASYGQVLPSGADRTSGGPPAPPPFGCGPDRTSFDSQAPEAGREAFRCEVYRGNRLREARTCYTSNSKSGQ